MKKNITLTGMMGAGKSFIAEYLVQRLEGFVAVDTDRLVEYHYGQFIPEMFSQKGEEYFRDAETQIIEKVYQKNNLIISLGGGSFEREKNRKIALENSTVIYLKATPQTLFERVCNSTNRPLLKPGFGVDSVAEILANREKNYKLAHYTIETDGKTPECIVNEILEIVG